jgi:hypothetical protein
VRGRDSREARPGSPLADAFRDGRSGMESVALELAENVGLNRAKTAPRLSSVV